jgi:hypothetical protein
MHPSTIEQVRRLLAANDKTALKPKPKPKPKPIANSKPGLLYANVKPEKVVPKTPLADLFSKALAENPKADYMDIFMRSHGQVWRDSGLEPTDESGGAWGEGAWADGAWGGNEPPEQVASPAVPVVIKNADSSDSKDSSDASDVKGSSDSSDVKDTDSSHSDSHEAKSSGVKASEATSQSGSLENKSAEGVSRTSSEEQGPR